MGVSRHGPHSADKAMADQTGAGSMKYWLNEISLPSFLLLNLVRCSAAGHAARRRNGPTTFTRNHLQPV